MKIIVDALNHILMNSFLRFGLALLACATALREKETVYTVSIDTVSEVMMLQKILKTV